MGRTGTRAAGVVALMLLAACTTAPDPAATPTPRLSDLPSVADDTAPSGPGSPTLTLPTPTPSRGVSVPGACAGEQLRATVTSTRSSATHRWVVVAVTNNLRTTCAMSGYPVIAAQGRQQSGLAQTVALPLAVAHGPVADRRDLGPRALSVRSGASASFAIGTTLGNRRRWTITRLSVRTDGAYGAAAVALQLPATQSGVTAIPVTVTGFVPGRSGPPLTPKPSPSRR